MVRTATYLPCQLNHNAQTQETLICKEPEKVENLVRVGNLEKGYSYPPHWQGFEVEAASDFSAPVEKRRSS
jgi:hypothetical protein